MAVRAIVQALTALFGALVLAGLLTGDELTTSVRVALFFMLALALVSPLRCLIVLAGLGPLVGGITAILGHHPADIQLLEGSVIAVLVGWSLRGLVGDRRAFPAPIAVTAALGAWLVYLVVSALVLGGPRVFTVDFYMNHFILGHRVGDPARTGFAMALGPWMALAAMDLLRSRADVARVAWAFVIGVSGAAALNMNRLIEAALRSETPWPRLIELFQSQRVNTLFPDFNAAGSWFVLAALVAIGLGRADIRRVSSSVAGLLAIMGVWLSGSRTAVMALGVVFAIWVMAALPPRRRLVSAIIGLVLCAVLLQVVTSRRQLSDADVDLSVQFRVMMLSAGWHMFLDHPVTGVGPGLFYRHSADYMDPDLRARMYPNENAHNNFLQILAETGVVGAVLFLSVLVTIGRAFWTQPSRDPLLDALCAGLFGFLLTCLLGHPLLLPNVAAGFWLIIGLTVGLLSTAGSTTSSSATRSAPHAG